jgi:RNA polymerase sigma-70 factor, ECF subfamily
MPPSGSDRPDRVKSRSVSTGSPASALMRVVTISVDDGGGGPLSFSGTLAAVGLTTAPTATARGLHVDVPFELEAERFVRAVTPRLVGALTIRTGSRAVAEDLAQEALARAWADWARVSTMHNPTGWVYRVAFNLAASHWRRRAAERRAERRSDPADPCVQLHTAEAVVLRDALARLSDRQQQVVILRYYLGCNVEETAEVLGVSQGTVKTQSSRAMARLRELVGARGVDL